MALYAESRIASEKKQVSGRYYIRPHFACGRTLCWKVLGWQGGPAMWDFTVFSSALRCFTHERFASPLWESCHTCLTNNQGHSYSSWMSSYYLLFGPNNVYVSCDGGRAMTGKLKTAERIAKFLIFGTNRRNDYTLLSSSWPPFQAVDLANGP